MSKDYRMVMCSGKGIIAMFQKESQEAKSKKMCSEPRGQEERAVYIKKMVIKRKDKGVPDKLRAEGGAKVR
jgi:hypothetical protein